MAFFFSISRYVFKHILRLRVPTLHQQYYCQRINARIEKLKITKEGTSGSVTKSWSDKGWRTETEENGGIIRVNEGEDSYRTTLSLTCTAYGSGV